MRELRWDWSQPPDPSHFKLVATVAERELWAIEHGLLVARCAALTAQGLKLPDAQVEQVSIAGLLHDVGKIAVEPAILQKPSSLSPEEFELVKRHPSVGARIAKALKLPEGSVTAIWHHHERVDRKGYPFGKGISDIPLEGRIVAIGELFSAFLTPRWYRPALSPAQALARIRDAAGESVDAELVRAFLGRVPNLFGIASRSTIERWTKPLPLEALVRGEEALVWQATNAFVSQALWEAERLFGQRVCQTLTEQLNAWFNQQKLPLHFRGLRLVSRLRWWQSLSDEVRYCRLLMALLCSFWGYLLGEPVMVEWLEGIRQALPERLEATGQRYGLWLWKEGRQLPFVAMK